jgi:hypothetical protein
VAGIQSHEALLGSSKHVLAYLHTFYRPGKQILRLPHEMLVQRAVKAHIHTE